MRVGRMRSASGTAPELTASRRAAAAKSVLAPDAPDGSELVEKLLLVLRGRATRRP